MLPPDEHRRIQAATKAQRNAGRVYGRRLRSAYAVSWQDHRHRRCLMCGRWVSEAGTSAHGYGFRWCEPCVLMRELREEVQRLDVGRAA